MPVQDSAMRDAEDPVSLVKKLTAGESEKLLREFVAAQKLMGIKQVSRMVR